MMDTQRLRFKGINGVEFPEWKKTSIEDLFEVSAGGDLDKDHFSHFKDDKHVYPIYANALTNGGLFGYSTKYTVAEKSITVTGRGEVGHATARDGKYTPIVRLLVCKPKNNQNTKFFEEAINRTNIVIESTGVPQLTVPQLKRIILPVPSLPEQQKIADFLSTYDEKIRLQRERVETLERRKKGLLQKIFSQEIRFNADDGIEFPAWTLKALGDIFSFKNGLNASRDSFENGNIPCIGVYDICRCAPITENAIRGYVSVDSNIKESFRVNFGDVLFQRSSETLQDVGHACVYIGKESVVYNGFVIKGTPKKQRQYIPEFIHWMLQSDFVRRQAIAFGAGAQHYNIGQESISSIIGYFPCVAEQKKIAKLFTAVDDQINIEKERLSTMETIKKGLLQGLFC